MKEYQMTKIVQERIAEALMYRGYFVSAKEDGLYLSSANHKHDRMLFDRVFRKLGIACTMEEGKIKVLSFENMDEVLEDIRFYPGQNHEAGGTAYRSGWKYFIQRKHGPKISTITLDPGIARLTKAISAVGIATIMCCDGHGRRAPYIIFDGAHNGIWFELIQKHLMQEITLHYQWEVLPERTETYMRLQGKKGEDQRWDLAHIQQDSYNMARFLLENMEELSDLKRNVFIGGLKPTKRLIKQMTVEEKKRWMAEKWEEYFRTR